MTLRVCFVRMFFAFFFFFFLRRHPAHAISVRILHPTSYIERYKLCCHQTTSTTQRSSTSYCISNETINEATAAVSCYRTGYDKHSIHTPVTQIHHIDESYVYDIWHIFRIYSLPKKIVRIVFRVLVFSRFVRALARRKRQSLGFGWSLFYYII